MPTNQQFDSAELRSLSIPYDITTPELSTEARIIAGLNMYVTQFGKLAKRPGSTQLGGFAVSTLPGPIDHAVLYETLAVPPLIWVVMSVLNVGTSLYEAWAVRLDGSGTPASLGTLRDLNKSTKPHEIVTSRGKCYIKSFPDNSHDKLGSVVFDGTTNTTTFWGLLGPTVPVALAGSVSGGVFTQSGWSSSTFSVTVNIGWSYVYTYKTITGQESCRSPLQTNLSIVPSNTGAFTNLCPKMTLTGHADTTNVPTIVIYRSTDGGGTFYKLQEITNVGGSITFSDQNFPDGNATPVQPYPDTALDTTAIAPSLTLNAPPPTVAAATTAFTTLVGSLNASNATCQLAQSFNGVSVTIPALPVTVAVDSETMIWTSWVTGSFTAYFVRGSNFTNISHSAGGTLRLTPVVGNDPVTFSTPIASYAGRLWYAIGNVLFYSGQEEIGKGVPEECFPSGLLGNFYRFNLPIVNVWATSEALYVFCTEEVYWLRGSTRDTFQLQKLFADVGARRNHPRAITAADKAVIWLTHDLRLGTARGYSRDFLSDQIAADLRNAVATNSCTVHLARHAELEKDWLVLLCTNSTALAGTASANVNQQWLYNFNEGGGNGIWSPPWNQRTTCAFAGQAFDSTDPNRYLIWGAVNGSGANCLVKTDVVGSTVQDFLPGSGATSYAANYTLGLVRNPTGNHVNQMREPGLTSVFYAAKVDRVAFASDTDPGCNFYFDDINHSAGTGTVVTSTEQPPRRVQSVGYTTLYYMSNQACERVSVQLFKSALNEQWVTEQIALMWNPDRGA